MRLGQLLINLPVNGRKQSLDNEKLFYLEDEEILEAIRKMNERS